MVFESLSTQWRVGFGGATGLDYNVIPTVASYLGIETEDMPYIFRDIRTMEAGVLKDWAIAREKANQTKQ